MRRIIFLFYILSLCLTLSASRKGLTEVYLSEYGSLEGYTVSKTIEKAIADLNGKKLILPDIPLDLEDVTITKKSNFSIIGSRNNTITCRNFKIVDCADFDLSNLNIKGTKNKFTTFYIVGDCKSFQIHDCLFDSEKGFDGHNTFYGIHIITDTSKPNNGYYNSPRQFRIYNNVLKHTRYDGILAHAYCSDFVIEYNTIEGAECIGIEIEGRLGDNKHTTVHPCKNAIIRHNKMYECGDWGVLLMWADSIQVYKNECFNSYGAFLSIGCTNLEVKNNTFEGRNKGFEISQEYYKVTNGINNHIVVANNVIRAKARREDYGVIDIRHARNVIIKKNKITSLYREKTSYVSLISCQYVKIKRNVFLYDDQPLADLISKSNMPSPENGAQVPELDLKNVECQKITLKKLQ